MGHRPSENDVVPGGEELTVTVTEAMEEIVKGCKRRPFVDIRIGGNPFCWFCIYQPDVTFKPEQAQLILRGASPGSSMTQILHIDGTKVQAARAWNKDDLLITFSFSISESEESQGVKQVVLVLRNTGQTR